MKVRNARNDNAHQASAAIAKQYSGVGVEDLNIKGMMQNRHLARRVAQVAWGQFVSYLEYKTNVKRVDRWFPSSQLCSKCGHRQKMPLNIRVYDCGGCGFVINRDLNAAINIRNNTFGTKEIYVCGDTSIGDVIRRTSRHVSLKQENVEADICQDIFGLDAHGSSARG
jgi:putative transposase